MVSAFRSTRSLCYFGDSPQGFSSPRRQVSIVPAPLHDNLRYVARKSVLASACGGLHQYLDMSAATRAERRQGSHQMCAVQLLAEVSSLAGDGNRLRPEHPCHRQDQMTAAHTHASAHLEHKLAAEVA